MSRQKNNQLMPFLGAAGIWLVLGLGLIFFVSDPESRVLAFGWFLLLWFLALADFVTIAALVFSIVYWEGTPDKARLGIRMGLLGVLKVGLLVIFGTILSLRHGIPTSSLLVGTGTLIVVPIFGGLAWSFKVKPGGST
ncbi:MAG: hypothetical protein KGQ59_05045 [Bdellovibrionales bacterium]|nr:hypothetical protein [Bdellovibrionales bacterium]